MHRLRRQILQFSACKYHIEDHVAYLTLNRPDKGNALNEQMITELTHIVQNITDEVHVLCIRGAGKNFCTGADLQEMQNAKSEPIKLALLMKALHDLNVPIVTAVNGAAFAGAMGLLANSDIVVAEENAIFCLSEVKLGLVPAMISPYVIEAIGLRSAKKIMLTAERLSAEQALQLGLIHQVVPMLRLDEALDVAIKNLLLNEPCALRAVKKLCREIVTIKPAEHAKFTADLLSTIRAKPQAQARLKAFFEKKNV